LDFFVGLLGWSPETTSFRKITMKMDVLAQINKEKTTALFNISKILGDQVCEILRAPQVFP